MMCRPTDPCGACDYCERDRLQDVANEVARYIQEENDELTRFVTLTLPGRGLEAGDTFDAQREDFRAMVHELMGKIEDRKGPTEWIGGIEAQENGNPHAHLLVDSYIDQGWLANAWKESGDGDDHGGHVKIQQVGGGGAGAAKYACAYVDGGVIGNI